MRWEKGARAPLAGGASWGGAAGLHSGACSSPAWSPEHDKLMTATLGVHRATPLCPRYPPLRCDGRIAPRRHRMLPAIVTPRACDARQLSLRHQWPLLAIYFPCTSLRCVLRSAPKRRSYFQSKETISIHFLIESTYTA